MSDAKYGEHGKIYSRKRRYYKNNSQQAKQNKSQMAEKSQPLREKPAGTKISKGKVLSSTEKPPAPRPTPVYNKTFYYPLTQKPEENINRKANKRELILNAWLLCIALAIGGMVIRMMLLYGR